MINRATKPNPTGKIKFSLPEINEFISTNGLKILFVKKNNLPLVQFLLLSNAGSIYDPAEKKGLSNLTAKTMIQKESSEQLESTLYFPIVWPK